MSVDIKPIFSYRKHWAQRFGIAPFLPMSRAEMETLGWGLVRRHLLLRVRVTV